MKNKRWIIITVKIFILLGIAALLFVPSNNVEFMQVVEKRIRDRDGDSSFYVKEILVENAPKKKMEQSKMMIAYYDNAGFSIDDLIIKKITLYVIYFFKSTYYTRKYYFTGKKSIFWDEEKTDLGSMWVQRCDEDTTKWMICTRRNLGTAWDYEHNGPDLETVVLLDPCEPIHPYWAIENKELENYYKELQRKKGALRMEKAKKEETEK